MTAGAEQPPRRLIVGVTGATGSIYAIRLLEALRGTDVETHLVLSRWGVRTLIHETDYTLDQVRALATHWYKDNDQGAKISSGSFPTMGMVILPCSVKTVADIAHGHSGELVHRAADVVLKERRRLVLAVREAPFTDIHLENMLKLSRMGVVISPLVPAFYNRPQSVDELVNHTVSRLLDLFDIRTDTASRPWNGVLGVGAAPAGKSGRPRRLAKIKARSPKTTPARAGSRPQTPKRRNPNPKKRK